MMENRNKTYVKTDKEPRKWYIIDAKEQNLGRLSSQIAYFLIGKTNITYTPHVKNEINIIIINSKLIEITGNKRYQKTYKRHSGRPGGLKVESFDKLQQKMPNKIIEHSIKGMLPKNTLGKKLFTQIKIYPNHIHPHSSQKPLSIKLN
uniref:50S ribosomal protein L13 n=1 Tax=Membranoptera platyphylla TaxID=1204437 RepID=A0A1I9KQM6_9FLOR|nr:50S ribosomal protein L13 [Membranoptera platyphylla]AMJ16910.1 50S ribosomal protein L13 [Membranoptera platyphylla]